MEHVPVEEYTTPNPVTAEETTSIEDIEGLMSQYGIRHIPVVKNGKVVGIVSDRDIRVIRALSLTERHVVAAADVMVKNPVTVSAGASLDEVALEMSKGKIGSVIVNDENDQFLGIFTATDALNALIDLARSESPYE